MGIKEQLIKLKDNWLIAVIIVVLFLLFTGIGSLSSSVGRYTSYEKSYAPTSSEMAQPDYRGGGVTISGSSFAPEVQNRLITKTASLSNEVERGDFKDAESKLKSIVSASNSYMLNQNANTYNSGKRAYSVGSYQIKVDAVKYDAVIQQLKDIGEVKSFNENSQDITGAYTDTKVEIDAEKARLQRYEKMYDEATNINDKIQLSDRIFDQERTVRYLEDSLKNMDQKVTYSTIYITISEKQPEYIDVVFVKFSELIRGLVNSFNLLITLIFALLPWGILLLIIRLAIKLFKGKKRK